MAYTRHQVMLDETTVRLAKELGGGNLSAGLRKLAAERQATHVYISPATTDTHTHSDNGVYDSEFDPDDIPFD